MEVLLPYLLTIDDPLRRERMRQVLAWVLETFPNLAPKIAWNQPMFTHHGTYIAGFSAAKQHMAMAPESVTLERFAGDIETAGYSHTRQLIHFPWDRPVDYGLLARMIAYNIQDKADCATFWRK